MMQSEVTIFGGSGFLGRLIARRFAKQGLRVRVAVRRPNEALFVRQYGAVGQVEPVQVNIRDENSVRRAVAGAEIVVNCVGILYEDKFQNFDDVHHIAAKQVALAAKEAGANQLVHISALGAALDAASEYLRSKAMGEAAVLEAFKSAIVLRPSFMFGGENDIFSKFANQARLLPFLPVIKGESKCQPVYVDDVAAVLEAAIKAGKSGIFEIGGEEMTMREILDYVSQETRRNRPLIPMPEIAAKLVAYSLSAAEFLSLGIIKNRLLTPDQLNSLDADNIVTDKNAFEIFGISPTPKSVILQPYMQAQRPRGEFEELVKPRL